jgi:tRNA nucleotidyltransferase (CCA-adding enzyme)
VRLAAMMVPLAPDGARTEASLRALKFSNAEAMLAARVVGVARAALDEAWTPPAVRRLLARTARDARAAAVEIWAAEPGPGAGRDALVGEARRVLAAGEPLEVGALAVTGADVMRVLDMKPGPSIGRILALLLDRVLDDPALNSRDELLRIAQQLELELGRD